MNTVLTRSEKTDLGRLEQTIQAGLAGFLTAGSALAEIRDRRLYRLTHATFEAYCRDRWGLGRSHAYRLIDASAAIETMSPTGGHAPAPDSERQVRPLIGLAPEVQQRIWQEATAGGESPTGARIAELAARALQGLSADEQLALIRQDEARVLAEAPAHARPPDARSARLAQAARLAGRLYKVLVGLGGEADTVLALVKQVQAEIDEL